MNVDAQVSRDMSTIGILIPILFQMACCQRQVHVGLIGNIQVDKRLTSQLKIERSADITFTRIPFNLDKPFIIMQRDVSNLIKNIDVVLAPKRNCSSIQVMLRQYGHKQKVVTCLSADSSGQDISLSQPPLLYVDSVIETIVRLKWTEVILIGDNENELATLAEELTADDILCNIFVYSRLLLEYNAHEFLINTTTFERGFTWNYLLIGQIEDVTVILKEAADFDVKRFRRTDMRSSSRWLVVVEDTGLHRLHLDIWLDNVAVMTYPNLRDNWFLAHPSDLIGSLNTMMYRVPRNGSEVRREFAPVGNFNCYGNVKNATQILPNLNFGFNGRPFVVDSMEVEVQRYCPTASGGLRMQNIRETGPYFIPLSRPFEWEPFTMIHNKSGKLHFEGLCIDLLHELSLDLNFTYVVKMPDDGEWGQEIAPGLWTGTVGEMQNNKIDMILAALTISTSRLEVMDFSYPFAYDSGGGIYSMPDSHDLDWKTLIHPFSWEVHLCLAVSFLVCTGLLFFLQWIYRDEAGQKLDISDAALFVWGMFIRYSHDMKSASASTSFFISSIWFFGTVCTAIYCGNMMAFFTVKKEVLPFRTMEEVGKQNTYKWGTVGGTFWVNIFEFGQGEAYQKIWQGIQDFNTSDPEVLSKSIQQHKEKVARGNYVYFVEKDMLKIWAQDNCRLRILENSVYQIRYGIGLPLHSPYTRLFSERVIAFAEEGLLVGWRRKWWRGEDTCADRTKNINAGATTLSQLQSAFYVLFIGIVLGTVAIFYEKIKAHFKLV